MMFTGDSPLVQFEPMTFNTYTVNTTLEPIAWRWGQVPDVDTVVDGFIHSHPAMVQDMWVYGVSGDELELNTEEWGFTGRGEAVRVEPCTSTNASLRNGTIDACVSTSASNGGNGGLIDRFMAHLLARTAPDGQPPSPGRYPRMCTWRSQQDPDTDPLGFPTDERTAGVKASCYPLYKVQGPSTQSARALPLHSVHSSD
jgi:hypothetical protein